MKSSFADIFRAFKYRNYRLYFIGQSVSFTGAWIQQVAMGWLVYRLTNSALMLGLIGFTSQAPAFFMAPFVGVLSENKDRRKILIYVQWFFMLQAALLTLLVLTKTVRIWEIITLSVMLGVVSGFDMTTRHTFFVDVVDKKEDLANAIALNSAMFNGSRLIGPAIAGVIIAAAGEGICFLVNTLCYAVVAVCLAMMNIKKEYPHVKFGEIDFIRQIKAGTGYAFSFRPIRDVIIIMCAVFFFASPFTVFMPVFARDVLKGGPQTMGILMSAMGAGALAGAVYIAAKKNVEELSTVLYVSAFLEAAGLLVFSASKLMWLSVISVAVAGAGVMIFNSTVNTLLQVLTDDDKRGRVMSFFIMAFTGIIPLGGLLQGWAAGKTGVPVIVFAGALLGAASAVVFIFNLKELGPIMKKVYVKKGMIPEAEDEAFAGAVNIKQ
jgi:MFS family permease